MADAIGNTLLILAFAVYLQGKYAPLLAARKTARAARKPPGKEERK
ncbi:MAG: hypothetical protein ING66_09110 [Rhodocyclaceae bacterium]|jgi:hypothetical protein|nr:hypothetical protein [Rhodocyclaceae bacterium]MCA3018719.1 hypothetical protein [Rhodocyclaceae bacterium]MCA3025588.1 hypothetical protein [Rhodocyclaceae bacterium]MCA3028744.1 hypothetical protein [Rhodocyclaceae bacterium]MCA3032863.1 hypothetical protein [Rhodocyclaceae bacterium]